MIDFSTPLSGMRAATVRMDQSAHDLANVNTKGFAQSQISQSEKLGGGTEIASIKKIPNSPDLPSNTQIAEEMVEGIVQSNTYKYNLKSIKTQDEMTGELLDLFG